MYGYIYKEIPVGIIPALKYAQDLSFPLYKKVH